MNALIKYDKVYFASCSIGIEKLLSNELQNLGTKKNKLLNGGVEFKTDELNIINIVFRSRLAGRIYKKIFTASIKNEKDIYNTSVTYPWTEIFNHNQSFAIKTIITKNVTEFNNGNYLSLILKDAVVDFFKDKFNTRPNVDKNNPDISFLQVIEYKNELTFSIYLDLWFGSLNKRGYRVEQTLAPIKENLASAMLEYAGIKNYDCFVDLFSGSGTFPIEAVLAKYDIPAQYLYLLHFKDELSSYAFMNNNIFKTSSTLVLEAKELINKLVFEIQKKLLVLDSTKATVVANDTYTIKELEANVTYSKFENIIKITNKDAASFRNPFIGKGLMLCNIPYGVRIETNDAFIEAFIKHSLKEFSNFDIYILSANENLENSINKKKFYNGPIKSYLHQINLVR